jgi:hypothetical protein
MNILRRYIDEILKESSTSRVRNLSQDELIALVDSLLGNDGSLVFTEKMAGTHMDVLVKPTGEALSRSKTGRAHGAPHGGQTSSPEILQAIEDSHPQPTEDINYLFEIIRSQNRPDYIDYLIGDQTVAVEYSGKLTDSVKETLNNSQSEVKFLSKEDITREIIDIPDNSLNILLALQDELGNSKISAERKKEIESELASVVGEVFSDSVLGGPTEGVFVSGGKRDFKIPTQQYSDIQRLQAPIYTIFSGRSSLSKKELKNRIIGVSEDPDKINSDKILQDLVKYLEAAEEGFPPGFRSFVSPAEAIDILDDLDDASGGSKEAAARVYKALNHRVSNRDSWHSA